MDLVMIYCSLQMWNINVAILFFDTGIGYDKYNILIDEKIHVDVIKFIPISDYCISILLVN